MDLAKTIKNIRTSNKLTQEEFGNAIFVSRSLVSKWERGLSTPDLFYLRKISKVFNVPLPTIIDENEKIKIEDYQALVEYVSSTLLKTNIFYYVPIFKYTLIILMMVSLLAIFVPTYKNSIYKENNYSLTYNNINSVSLITIDNNNIYTTTTFEKKTPRNSNTYYLIENLTIDVLYNPADIYELYKKVTVIIEFINGTSCDLPRVAKLRLIKENNYLMFKSIYAYPFFASSGTYDVVFYIENEIGYLGAFLSN